MTSDAEEALAFQLRAVGIAFEREYRFHPKRQWRADFFISGGPKFMSGNDMLLVEVDGGGYTGGRHSTGPGMERDCEKQSAAAIAGYRTIRCTPKQVESGDCLRWIESAR